MNMTPFTTLATFSLFSTLAAPLSPKSRVTMVQPQMGLPSYSVWLLLESGPAETA